MRPKNGNPPPETLGERSRRLRKEKGWTQGDLARRVGIKSSRISKYENGTYQPSLATVKAIADALGTTTDHLLGCGPGTDSDARLKDLLSRLDELPAEPRNALAEMLEALFKIHRYVEHQSPSKRQA
jgi:transcriptional regulator with XRE-family HTH domain